jgi:hypothetical protein
MCFIVEALRFYRWLFNIGWFWVALLSDNKGPLLPVRTGLGQFELTGRIRIWHCMGLGPCPSVKRIRPMYHKFIATITAVSIAITGLSATSAAAGDRNRDLARIAVGVLGVAIIGKIISDNNKDRKQQAYVNQGRANRDHVVTRQQIEPRPLPRKYRKQKRHHRHDSKLLPQNCFRSYDTRRGQVLMFGSRCLQNNYRHANRLPQHCAQTIRTFDGKRRGYDARCLRGAGYRLARG